MISRKIILLFLIFLVQTPGFADVTEKVPDPVAWFGELQNSSENGGIQLANYVVVRKVDRGYEKVVSDLNKDIFFADPVPQDFAVFADGLNNKLPSGGCGASPSNMGYCLGASYVLDVTSSIWQLYTVDAKGGYQAVLAKKSSSTQNYSEWMKDQLGFDGMIIASKDGFLLAQVPATSIPGDSQALAIKGSEDKTYLGATEKRGEGLFAILKRTGKLATLTTVISAGTKPPEWRAGLKIIIETNKKRQ